MMVIVIFAALVLILDTVGAAISSLLESTSEWASLLAFLGFFVVNFIIAWKCAVFLTERYLLTDSQKKANEDHIRWVNSIFSDTLAADLARTASVASDHARMESLELAGQRQVTR